jgi:hypothetical protein
LAHTSVFDRLYVLLVDDLVWFVFSKSCSAIIVLNFIHIVSDGFLLACFLTSLIIRSAEGCRFFGFYNVISSFYGEPIQLVELRDTMKILAVIASASFLLAGCVVVSDVGGGQEANAPAASAPATSGAEQVAEAETPRATDQLVCRTERVTGSNRPRRVCRTQRQIQEAQEAATSNMSNSGNNSCSNCGGGD